MTQEEKAKAYDNAIKVAESIHRFSSDPAEIKRMEQIFPELAESEDERIRKELIRVFSNREKYVINQSFGDINVSDILSWLEKQGEHKKFRDSIQVGDKVTRNQDDMLVNLSQLKRIAKPNETKQSEQKSVDLPKGEDYGIDGLYAAVDILQKTLGKVDGYQTDDGILEHKCAISAVKSLYEQKPAWTEEDEKQARQIERIVHNDGCTQKLQKQIADWLKSLKDRVQLQPKQEILEKLKEWLDEYVSDLADVDTASLISSFTNYLDGKLPKSLRPHSQWKPSDEQMKALWEVYKGGEEQAALASLYSDLKKLMEK